MDSRTSSIDAMRLALKLDSSLRFWFWYPYAGTGWIEGARALFILNGKVNRPCAVSKDQPAWTPTTKLPSET